MSPKLVGGEVVAYPADAIALGRFRSDGPIGFIAATSPCARVRNTRAEAVEDERAHYEKQWLDTETGES
jgi:hypothetical protein